MVHEDEARNTVELEEMFVVQPTVSLWFGLAWQSKGRTLPDGFRYSSDNNPQWLDVEQIRQIVAPFEKDEYPETAEF